MSQGKTKRAGIIANIVKQNAVLENIDRQNDAKKRVYLNHLLV